MGFRIEKTVLLDLVVDGGLMGPTHVLREDFLVQSGFDPLTKHSLTPKQISGGFYLGGYALLTALSMAIMYTWAQEDPNRQVHFFIVNMAAKYIPFASLAVTYVLAGPFMTMVQATGILAAHLYDFLDRIWPEYGGGIRVIQVPQFVQKMFEGPAGVGQERAGGTAFRPRADAPRPVNQNPTGSGGAFASGDLWNSRGSGRRLGGE